MHLPAADREILCNGHQPEPHSQSRDGHTSIRNGRAMSVISTSSTTLDPRASGLPEGLDPAQIPLSAALLAWRLLITRSGEDDAVESIVMGSVPGPPTLTPKTSSASQPSSPLSGYELAVPKFPFATGGTMAEALEESAHALADIGQAGDARLGSQSTLYFSDASRSDHAPPFSGSGKKVEPQQDWTFYIELLASSGQLHLKVQWRTTHVTQCRAARGLHTFIAYLGAILSLPHSTSVWDILGPQPYDLDQIWSWNAAVPPTINKCIHELVSERALEQPDKVAVSAWDGDFTYREVEHLSSALARRLRGTAGVRVGDIVMLVFEKSRWTTPALLGVLKSGAAFVLTDPAQPEARLRTMAAQTRCRAVVSSEQQQPLALRIAQDGGEGAIGGDPLRSAAEVLVASDAALLGYAGWGSGVSEFLPVVPPTAPMYVIFTSGSTGVPKGVMCSHQNFVSGAVPRAEAVGYGPHSRVFEFASYAFDVSIDCMLCTLLAGGTVCVPSEAARVDDPGAAILASGANMAHMTPSVARVLDDAELVMGALDVLGLGGEAVSAGDAAAWSGLTRVVIAYGPSECTVGCTINSGVGAENTTIGKGTGAVTWIVDPEDHDRLMPVGSVGELLIEGPVVGLGYLGEPGKTAEVFIDEPEWLARGYGKVPGRKGKLYKTGDLVKYDADGFIEFVGRKDQQVKLRGQRVELAEIEHHLQGMLPHGVKIAAEVIRPSGAEPTLVVFVTEPNHGVEHQSAARDGIEKPARLSRELEDILAEMDNILGEELPRYMIPTAYIPLAEMPTLPSAKTDRKKLKAQGSAMTREQIARLRIVDTPAGRPTTELERELEELWKRVLNTGLDISLHDSFFGLGGDSLRAMKLVSAARTKGVALTVADVFSNPTLKAMASVAVKDGTTSATAPQIPAFSLLPNDWPPSAARNEIAELCAVSESSIEDIYPCTPLQEGLMALSAKFQDSYVAQRVLELEDVAAARKLQRAFEAASQDCAILRTRIVQVPGRGLQQVVVREPIEWRSGAATVELYLEADRADSMDLGKALVRYGVIHRPSGKVDFVLTMHHALYDGWSMPLVIERVNRAYDGESAERPAEFKNFISFLEGMDRETCETYWRDQLDGANGPQFPTLPYEGYITQADSLLEHFIPIQGCPASNTTVATVIRGAWALVASQYTGTRDIVFGETLTGRNAPVAGVDLIEGPMITTVPVRVRVDKDVTVETYLKGIYKQTVQQMPYEHTGLQHIRRLSPDALEACELRTGLVLHPATTREDEEALQREQARYPASRLVPANDAEAAQEALKFNTYALMLVCSLSPDGFLVMASFDSNAVDKATMERVLVQLSRVTQQLCGATDRPLKEVERLMDADLQELLPLSKSALAAWGLDNSEHLWIVDPEDSRRLMPRGAVGEVLIDTSSLVDLPTIETPPWYDQISTTPGRDVHVYPTGQLARFDAAGDLAILGKKGEAPQHSKPLPEGRHEASPKTIATATDLSPRQIRLRDLWARVLRMEVDSITLEDSFFRLGGDSIAAMKLVAEARPAGLRLTVAQIFKNKTLAAMADAAEKTTSAADRASDAEVAGATAAAAAAETITVAPFSLLSVPDTQAFVAKEIQARLASSSWKVVDVLPTRPLQDIAVRGSTEKPRFSIRYEALYFDSQPASGCVDRTRLLQSCQQLIANNEILRTVFVRVDGGTCYSVVLEDLVAEVEEHHLPSQEEMDIRSFTRSLCDRDIEGDIPLGSSFVKFFLVRSPSSGSPGALVIRISHAQYDEICLPVFLRQLAALYDDNLSCSPTATATIQPQTVPFSHFVHHTLRTANPASTAYWTSLLAGAPPPTVLQEPGVSASAAMMPSAGRAHHATHRAVDVSAHRRRGQATAATLPTAAWALCLARRTGRRDVVFGEVVSGRSSAVPLLLAGGSDDGGGGEVVVGGPCWQYVPVRVVFPADGDDDDGGIEGAGEGRPHCRTGDDLLGVVEHQHAAGSAHEGMALGEIAAACTAWPPERAGWFDTVVHQDVEHVEGLEFGPGGTGIGIACAAETIYPHQEPLREWKIQAFFSEGGDKLTMEVVTFEAWRDAAEELLDELVRCVEELVQRPGDVLRFG